MGTTKLNHDELADRIDGVRDASGKRTPRYELAYKPEVKAFVDRRLRQLSAVMDEEIAELTLKSNERDAWAFEQADAFVNLEKRIADLELIWWARVKRAFTDWIVRICARRFPDGDTVCWSPEVEQDMLVIHKASQPGHTELARCQVPPDGWWCSREPGHDGPCAARPYEIEDLETQSGEIAEAIRALNSNRIDAHTGRIDADLIRAFDDPTFVTEDPELCRYGCGNVHPALDTSGYEPAKFAVCQRTEVPIPTSEEK